MAEKQAAPRTATTASSSSGGSGRKRDQLVCRSRSNSPDDDEPACRICYRGSSGGRLLSPCHCSGSVGLVHEACLKAWLSAANGNLFGTCELCYWPYPAWLLPVRCKRARLDQLERQRIPPRHETERQQRDQHRDRQNRQHQEFRGQVGPNRHQQQEGFPGQGQGPSHRQYQQGFPGQGQGPSHRQYQQGFPGQGQGPSTYDDRHHNGYQGQERRSNHHIGPQGHGRHNQRDRRQNRER